MHKVTVKVLMSIGIVVALLCGILVDHVLYVPPVPLIREPWWGPGNQTLDAPGVRDSAAVRPYRINVSQETLEDLRYRILNSRRTIPLDDANQEYGINANVVFAVANRLLHAYNWTERERQLNAVPQFVTSVQGLQIHFAHVKPQKLDGSRYDVITADAHDVDHPVAGGADSDGHNAKPRRRRVHVLPLLMLHGFPSSMVEFLPMLADLTAVQPDRDFVFEVIVPNMPGFGTSDGTHKAGLGCVSMATIMKNLMRRLGYKRYYIFGTDWGSLIASNMGVLYPDQVLGIYSPLCVSFRLKSLVKFFLWELYPFKETRPANYRRPFESLSVAIMQVMREMGYFAEFGNRPDTNGIGLNDSPVGLLAQMLDLFTRGTDYSFQNLHDAGLSHMNIDMILDNFMIHWAGGQVYSSTRIYAESLAIKEFFSVNLIPVDPRIPVSCPKLPGEAVYMPDWILRDKYPHLVRSADFAAGGHFYNYERRPRVSAMSLENGCGHHGDDDCGDRSAGGNEMVADLFASVAEMRLVRRV